jgi:hypothetical protein
MIHAFPSPDTLTRLRPQITETRYKERIINTLLENRKCGLAESTLLSIAYSLEQIDKHADLNNPEAAKAYIANAPICNGTRIKLCYGYNWFCKTNGI